MGMQYVLDALADGGTGRDHLQSPNQARFLPALEL
jgi:hypothetical protein